MYKVILLSLALIQTQWLHAQTSVQNALTNTPHPALEAPASAYKAWAERPDYLSEQGVTRYAWSLRDRKWAEIPQPLFGVTGGLIKGPRALRPESVQEYQLACVSLYQGTVKHLWRYEPGQSQPIKVGSIHSNDEVEIEWGNASLSRDPCDQSSHTACDRSLSRAYRYNFQDRTQ